MPWANFRMEPTDINTSDSGETKEMASDFGTITIKLDPEVQESLDRICSLLESDVIKELLERLESLET